MTVLGVDTVAIVVSDRRKAIRWYRDVLGSGSRTSGRWTQPRTRASKARPTVRATGIELGPPPAPHAVHLCEMGGVHGAGPTGVTFVTDDIRGDYDRMRAKESVPVTREEDGLGGSGSRNSGPGPESVRPEAARGPEGVAAVAPSTSGPADVAFRN